MIVRTALRLATVKALSGRTYAGTRVRDSSIVPITEALGEEPKPVILVYTDDDESPIEGLDFLTPMSGSKTLILLIAVAGAVEVEGDTVIQFPPTDAAAELAIDLIERDVVRALLDPRSAWGDIWRRLAVRATRWRSTRGASTEEGIRYAARQIVIELDALSEPVPGGDEPDGVWEDFIAAVSADPDEDFAALAPILSAAITGAALTEEEREQIALGLTNAGRMAFADTAPALDRADDGEEPAILQEVVIDAANPAAYDPLGR